LNVGIGLTVGHHAADPVEAAGQTCLHRYGGLGAVTGIPIAQAQAPWEALTAHAETQEPLLEISRPICAVPLGWPRRDRPCAWAGLLFRGSVQGDRRRILLEPGGREGIDLQGVEGDGTKDAVALRGTQRLEHRAEAVIVQRRSSQTILEHGEHSALLSACPHLIEGMMASENRQEQRFYATATREDMRGVRRADSLDQCSDVERADDPQHQRQVGHRTDVLNRNGHEGPLLQSF